MKSNALLSRAVLICAFVVAAACAFAQRGPFHYYGSVYAQAPSLKVNEVTVGANGELWCDFPSWALPKWHVFLKVDGVIVWDNGAPDIPNTGWPGLVFGYTPLTYTLPSGLHYVEWVGAVQNPGMFLVTGWFPGFYYAVTYNVP